MTTTISKESIARYLAAGYTHVVTWKCESKVFPGIVNFHYFPTTDDAVEIHRAELENSDDVIDLTIERIGNHV